MGFRCKDCGNASDFRTWGTGEVEVKVDGNGNFVGVMDGKDLKYATKDIYCGVCDSYNIVEAQNAPPEKPKGQESKMVDMDKAFSITSVCREDLTEKFSQEQIEKLDDFDMARLASKMADTYVENSFWIDLEILAEYILEEKEEQIKKGRGKK